MSALPSGQLDSSSTETGWTPYETSALCDTFALGDQSPILDAILNYLDTLPSEEPM
jgi:hypothetical protein